MEGPIRSRSLYVSYSQLAVFAVGLDQPFNDWSPRHVAQGFAWRQESVSFRFPEWDANTTVTVSIRDKAPDEIDGMWAVRVPFSLVGGRGVEVASISDSFDVAELADGTYDLYYAVSAEDPRTCELVFVPVRESLPPSVLVAGDGLEPESPLLMEADPA